MCTCNQCYIRLYYITVKSVKAVDIPNFLFSSLCQSENSLYLTRLSVPLDQSRYRLASTAPDFNSAFISLSLISHLLTLNIQIYPTGLLADSIVVSPKVSPLSVLYSHNWYITCLIRFPPCYNNTITIWITVYLYPI